LARDATGQNAHDARWLAMLLQLLLRWEAGQFAKTFIIKGTKDHEGDSWNEKPT